METDNKVYNVPIENPNQDFTNSNATNSNTSAYISNEDLIAKLTSKTNDMSTNLKNQRELINNFADENKLLKEENEKLVARIKEFETNANNYQGNDRLAKMEEELAALQQQSASFAQRERDAKLIPIIEEMQSRGIAKENVTHVFNQIKEQYGVDLVSNPNIDTAKLMISQLTTFTGGSQIPQGASGSPANADYEKQKYEALVNEYRSQKQDEVRAALAKFNQTGKL